MKCVWLRRGRIIQRITLDYEEAVTGDGGRGICRHRLYAKVSLIESTLWLLEPDVSVLMIGEMLRPLRGGVANGEECCVEK